MPRPRNTEARRAQIVDALARVVARDGLAGATMAEVAAEAGLAQGLLHYHFGSKHEMVVALVAHHDALTEARFHRYSDADPPRRRLHAWLDAVAAGGAVALELAAEARRDAAVGAAWSARVAAWDARTEALVADVATAEGRPAPPLAARLLAVVLGQVATGAPADHGALVEAVFGPPPPAVARRPADDWALWR